MIKLRNIKTGEIRKAEAREDGIYLWDEQTKNWWIYELDMLARGWEYYVEPKEPLIKDEEIRNAVQAWADYHNITEVNCYIGTWDHAGICIPDSVLQLHSIRDRIVIQFFMNADKREKIKEGVYTIAELCGEEEE